jgi:ribosome-binding ATPase YchF (GTP1/OBG family)
MPSLALIGPPGSGKSTVFELLGGIPSRGPLKANFTADRAMVPVHDPRFDKLRAMFNPKKATPVQVEVLDVPGFDLKTDPKLQTAAMSEVRKADGLAIVLDLFRPGAAEGALASLRTAWEEIVFSDYAVVTKGIESVEMAARSKHNADAERRHTFLLSLVAPLEAGTGLRGMSLGPDAEKLVRQYGLLTRRPILALANLAEEDLANPSRNPAVGELRAFCEERQWPLFLLSAKVESEIAMLDPDDRKELLAAYHLEEPGLHRFLRHAYAALSLITFFTVGEDEVRGWTIRRDSPARQAAGVIHSDLERGFIRGEVIHWSLLAECGSLPEAKKRGILRLEGKDYPVQDGEILHVRFSV